MKKNKTRPPRRTKLQRQVMGITWFFVILFVAMSGYISYYALANEVELAENPYNGLQQILMEQNSRGRIYASGGEVLADSVIDAEGQETRVYPYGQLFAHVVGFASHGRAGIEAAANYYLIHSNIPLPQKAENGSAGVKNPGDSVYSTLRVDLQETAANAMGVYRGAIIVSEPHTGRILAMVSKPDFDPAQIPDIWEDLLKDDQSSILINRVTQGLYPPGSTFKIFTALGYLREHELSLDDYSFNCVGHFDAYGERINCFRNIAHGSEDFEYSFAKSCNSSFANIGVSLDQDELEKTLDELLFGADLPSPLVYNKSSVDLNEDTPKSELMQITIGQGKTQITPQHLHLVTNAIANGGVLMRPYLYDEIRTENGSSVRRVSDSRAGRLMSAEEAAELGALMQAVVLNGTATRLQSDTYTAAGKTGSAEYGNVKGASHAWFTGFAPADDPQIAVTILIEGAGSGGDYAVPIAKRIFDVYFE